MDSLARIFFAEAYSSPGARIFAGAVTRLCMIAYSFRSSLTLLWNCSRSRSKYAWKSEPVMGSPGPLDVPVLVRATFSFSFRM